MKKFFLIICIIVLTISIHAQVQIGQDIDGEAAGDHSGVSVSMPDAKTVAIGAAFNNGNGTGTGNVRIFTLNGYEWVQKGTDINGEAAFDYSGVSVSMPDENTVAIGAPFNDGNTTDAGHVRIYVWNGSAWVQKGSDIDGEDNDERSGMSVSMPDANTVAIGASNNDRNGTDAGLVRIFAWNGSDWVQKGLGISGEAAGDHLGVSVSMPDANTVAMGAPDNDGNGSNSGHVRIFSWNGSAWVQKGSGIDGEAANDESGYVNMPDANTVAIGAPYNDGSGVDAGHVRIFSWNGSAWVQKGADINGEADEDWSGISVSMPDANNVAIGALKNDGNGNNSGQVRIYTWKGSAWEQNGADIDGEAVDDWSGVSVSMPDANIVAIGAQFNDGNGSDAGHVRIYKLCNTFGTNVVTACDSYMWIDGNTYTASNNTATYTLVNAAGCDSVITLNLTINHSTTSTDVITACDSYTWIDGNTYTSSNNTATYTLTNAAGCDSVITLDLTINNSTSSTDVVTACDSYTWIDGNTYMVSNNTATYTLINAAGCDSVVSLNLTINHSIFVTDTITACDSYTWIDGNTYTASNNTASFTLTSTTGCDSVVTLDLTISHPTSATDLITACDSYTWIDGNTYTANNNTATYTLANAAGCDSVVTLNLTINRSTSSTDVITACESYTWIDGNTYTASNNTATFTLTNAAGCDSVVSLDLTINTVDISVTNLSPTLTANATDAIYQWLDCDNNMAVITGETNQSFAATGNGNYAVEITQNGCIDTSVCEIVSNLGILENDFGNTMIIYPNPTDGILSIDLAKEYPNIDIILRNIFGQEINQQRFSNTNKFQFHIQGGAGIYFIEIFADNRRALLKVIKE